MMCEDAARMHVSSVHRGEDRSAETRDSIAKFGSSPKPGLQPFALHSS